MHQIYCTDFGSKYGGFFWETFFQGLRMENCSTSGSIVDFEDIRENVLVIGISLLTNV